MNAVSKKLIKISGVVAVVILALLLPLIFRNDFYLNGLVSTYMYAIMALGLVLVLVTGRLSLGQVGFFAIGAYASALMVTRLGISFWLALPLAGIIAGIFGLTIGLIIIRRSGITFIMMTWAFAEVINQVIGNQTSVLGGRGGIIGIPSPNPINFGLVTVNFHSVVAYYYLILVLLILVALFLWRLYQSRYGTVLRSLNQADKLAQSLGVDIVKYRLFAFSLAAVITGLAGSFYAHYLHYINPSYFDITVSVNVLVYSIIGGVYNFIAGPMVGTVVLTTLSNLLVSLVSYKSIIYGVALIAITLFLSGGLASLPRFVLDRIKRKRYETVRSDKPE